MKQAIAVVAGVLLVVGALIYGISRTADVSPLDPPTPEEERDTAQAWESEAIGAFGGVDLTNRVLSMVEGARKWLAGEQPTDEYRTELADREVQFGEVRDRLAELRGYPYDDRVVGLYRQSAELYAQVVEIYQAMVETPPGDGRTQLDLHARRVRILADRVFDRGHALVKPKLNEPERPDVDVRLPVEVPVWVEEGIAPGPPIADVPGTPTKAPQLRERTRPRQDRDDWLEAVDRALPEDRAGAAATVVEAAARQIWRLPDPDGDREESARAALSLLIDAEGARAAQLGMPDVAAALHRVAPRVWSR